MFLRECFLGFGDEQFLGIGLCLLDMGSQNGVKALLG